jgi:hypothetical protein
LSLIGEDFFSQTAMNDVRYGKIGSTKGQPLAWEQYYGVSWNDSGQSRLANFNYC